MKKTNQSGSLLSRNELRLINGGRSAFDLPFIGEGGVCLAVDILGILIQVGICESGLICDLVTKTCRRI